MVLPDEYELPRKFRRPEDVPCSRTCSDIRADKEEFVDKGVFLVGRKGKRGDREEGAGEWIGEEETSVLNDERWNGAEGSLVSRYIRVWPDKTRYLVSAAHSFIALVTHMCIARRAPVMSSVNL